MLHSLHYNLFFKLSCRRSSTKEARALKLISFLLRKTENNLLLLLYFLPLKIKEKYLKKNKHLQKQKKGFTKLLTKLHTRESAVYLLV